MLKIYCTFVPTELHNGWKDLDEIWYEIDTYDSYVGLTFNQVIHHIIKS